VLLAERRGSQIFNLSAVSEPNPFTMHRPCDAVQHPQMDNESTALRFASRTCDDATRAMAAIEEYISELSAPNHDLAMKVRSEVIAPTEHINRLMAAIEALTRQIHRLAQEKVEVREELEEQLVELEKRRVVEERRVVMVWQTLAPEIRIAEAEHDAHESQSAARIAVLEKQLFRERALREVAEGRVPASSQAAQPWAKEAAEIERVRLAPRAEEARLRDEMIARHEKEIEEVRAAHRIELDAVAREGVQQVVQLKRRNAISVAFDEREKAKLGEQLQVMSEAKAAVEAKIPGLQRALREEKEMQGVDQEVNRQRMVRMRAAAEAAEHELEKQLVVKDEERRRIAMEAAGSLTKLRDRAQASLGGVGTQPRVKSAESKIVIRRDDTTAARSTEMQKQRVRGRQMLYWEMLKVKLDGGRS